MRAQPPRHRAFTLVELLVVMSVIAILMSLLVPTLHAVRRQVNETRCEAMIHGLSMAAESYKQMYYAYPPDPPDPNPNPAEICYSSQSLVYHLSGASIVYGPGNAPSEYPWKHPFFKDPSTQGNQRRAQHVFYQFNDDMLKDLKSGSGEIGLPGIIDPWGVPLFYNAPGGGNGNPKHNVQGFDLLSAGVDGKLGTDDDIGNFKDSKPGYTNEVDNWKPAE
jgi:prepilin-type N-terminal cleavage/methylation domain-containing protein